MKLAVIYTAETWTLTKSSERMLGVWESRILRRIYRVSKKRIGGEELTKK